MNLLIFLAIFVTWFVPFVFLPAARVLTKRARFRGYSAYLTYCTVAFLTYSIWAPEDRALVFLAPLTPLFAPIDYSIFASYGFTSIFWLASSLAIITFAAMFWFRGVRRLVSAVILPAIAVTVSVLTMARISDREIREEFLAFGGTCLDARPFLVSLKDQWRYSFHAVARKGGDLFNWSYRSHSWEPIPQDERSKFFEYAPTGGCAPE